MTDKLTLDELVAKLEKHVPDLVETFGSIKQALKDYEFYDCLEDDENFKSLGVQGGEGQGDDYRGIIHHIPTDQYFGASGWYASHDGGYLEDITEMKPIPSTYFADIN